MLNITTGQAKKHLAAILKKVIKGDRVLLKRHDKPCAAIVSVEDLQLIQRLEDHDDVVAARAALLMT